MADLTLEQRSAAESRGCRFVPATREQIATLAMQRRVFWVDGQAFLERRQDGFLETAATLHGLLEQPPWNPPVTASASKRPVNDANKAAALRPRPAAMSSREYAEWPAINSLLEAFRAVAFSGRP
jgi:hypothetical protein